MSSISGKKLPIKAKPSTHPVPTGYEPRSKAEVTGVSDDYSSSASTAGQDSEEQVQQVEESEEEDMSSGLPTLNPLAIAASTGPSSYKYSASNGLYGDNSVPATLPPMPKLGGATAHQYNDWKLKALSYFKANGLTEIATLKPSESLSLAIAIDGGARLESQIRALWARLHSRVYGAIRGATELIIGTSFLEEIETDSSNSLSLGAIINAAPNLLDERFKLDCAYYLWESIRVKLERYTPHDISRLINNYMSLRYNPRSNPLETRAYFDNCVRELKLAGLVLPDKAHLGVWYNAIPNELESLRQALGAKEVLKWTDIFNAIQDHYLGRRVTRVSKPEEKAHGAFEQNKRKGKQAPKGRNLSSNLRKNTGEKPVLKCLFCEKDGHIQQYCPDFHNASKNAKGATQGYSKKSNSDSEAEDHGALFIPEEIVTIVPGEEQEETVAFNREDSLKSKPAVVWLFDSGATTHVSPVRGAFESLTDAPTITMSTAITGQRGIISKRGTVRLNQNWVLRDVAYVPQASASLISEGRLCDAGYTIHKEKEFLHVRKDGKSVLRAVRVNRLWVYVTDGQVLTQRPLNTLVNSRTQSAVQEREKKIQPPISRRTIPRKESAKTAASSSL
jgi:hypothetical protein